MTTRKPTKPKPKVNAKTMRLIRTVSGLTQREFGMRVRLSTVFIAKVECGQRNLSARSADRILRAFKMSAAKVRELEAFADALDNK